MAAIIVPLNNGNKLIIRVDEIRAIETFTRTETPKLFWVRLHLDGSMDFANGNSQSDDDFIDIPFKSEENRANYFDEIAVLLEESGEPPPPEMDDLRTVN